MWDYRAVETERNIEMWDYRAVETERNIELWDRAEYRDVGL